MQVRRRAGHGRRCNDFNVIKIAFGGKDGDFLSQNPECVAVYSGCVHKVCPEFTGPMSGDNPNFPWLFDTVIGALNPQPPPDTPRVMEIAKIFGLEFLPPLGA